MMQDAAYSKDNLPPWFRRPSRGPVQQSLFPDQRKDVLRSLGVGEADLREWRTVSLLSFEPDRRSFLPHEFGEMRFVRDVLRSGLRPAMARRLIRGLPDGVVRDPWRLAYNFTRGWVEPVSPPEPAEVIEGHLYDWLEEMAAEGRTDELAQIAKQIVDILGRTTSDENEVEGGGTKESA